MGKGQVFPGVWLSETESMQATVSRSLSPRPSWDIPMSTEMLSVPFTVHSNTRTVPGQAHNGSGSWSATEETDAG